MLELEAPGEKRRCWTSDGGKSKSLLYPLIWQRTLAITCASIRREVGAISRTAYIVVEPHIDWT